MSQNQNARGYQAQSIDLIRNEFLKGNRKVLLWLATGGGKTFIFCKMVKEAVTRGKKAIIVVRGRKLVDQASHRLIRENVEHGVLMANHWNYRPHLPVQVCSVDTLIARSLKPEADLIIIDEAHLSTSKGYKEFLAQYNAFIVAVTATPFVEASLRHVANSVVHPISMTGLVDLGFLVPFRIFAPSSPDLTDVKVSSSTKDYVVNQLEPVMSTRKLTGKIIDHWKKIANDRPTICFAVNIKHSKLLVEQFLENGIKAEHCDAETKDSERERIIERLESGETKVVCNVGILCTGVDIPSLGAIILARPTCSKNLYIQQCGRGTRPFQGKENCILLDHAGNVTKHGYPSDEPQINLDGRKIVERAKTESKVCEECFAVYRGKLCPECGSEKVTKTHSIDETDELLKELAQISDPIKRELVRLQDLAKHTGRKPAWCFYKLTDTFGLVACMPYVPKWFVKLQTEPKPFKSNFEGVRID